MPSSPIGSPKDSAGVFASRFKSEDLCQPVALQPGMELIEEYEIRPPFSRVMIVKEKESGTLSYMVIEPTLNQDLMDFYEKARQAFVASLDSFPRTREDRTNRIREFLNGYSRIPARNLEELEIEKILYFFVREFEGFGPVEVPLLDNNVEDISCVGTSAPVFIVHRRYGPLASNVAFKDDNELDNYIRLIVQRSGKHISIAVPMVDCTLQNGSRLQATLGREVTTNGPSFTIRRFRDEPFTPLDLVELGTLDPYAAVYLWRAVEKGQNMFIVGGTASGKTTTLNSILLFVPVNKKVVSIEDTRELKIPHENWVQTVTRQGTGDVNPATGKRIGEFDMFDLLVNSLRQRPNFVVIGEVRGREAYTVFQSMATGQSAIATFHSSDIPSFIHRLEGEPLNIPRSMLSSLNIVVLQGQVRRGAAMLRRVKKIVEIVGIDKYSNEVETNTAFEWDPASDKLVFSGHSYFLDQIIRSENETVEYLNLDTNRRLELIERLRKRERINSTDFVSEIESFRSSNTEDSLAGGDRRAL